ncbi:MAG: hypothetical protein EOP67_35295, partial [Sphingomonas sp.]
MRARDIRNWVLAGTSVAALLSACPVAAQTTQTAPADGRANATPATTQDPSSAIAEGLDPAAVLGDPAQQPGDTGDPSAQADTQD